MAQHHNDGGAVFEQQGGGEKASARSLYPCIFRSWSVISRAIWVYT